LTLPINFAFAYGRLKVKGGYVGDETGSSFPEGADGCRLPGLAQSHDTDIELHGVVTPDKQGKHEILPFTVPPEIERMEVKSLPALKKDGADWSSVYN
jgi:hypothetical protein